MSRNRSCSCAVVAAFLMGCGDGGPNAPGPAVQRPVRPASGIEVGAGGPLQAHVDAAKDGAVLILGAGDHAGPVSIDKPLTVWGPPDAVVRSNGTGSTIDVVAPNVTLLGFGVDGSGGRFDLTDAAIRVRADDARIEGVTIEHALFGILVERCRRALVRGNSVRGNGQPALGMRGDGIRLWEVRDSLVANNRVADCRDVVVWYSSENRLEGNTVERSRYGTHLMYSHHNVIASNSYVANVVSVFLMYSNEVVLEDNLLARSNGAAGLGLGLKESGNIRVVGNRFIQNGCGIHSDNSPLDADAHNTFERNLLRGCGTAVAFNGIAERATFRGNAFRDNMIQVRVDGGDDARSITWTNNDFDDYRGYDFDGDGVGDVPYELRSLSTQLTGRYPELEFFRGTPAFAAIDLASHVMPLFRTTTILVDEAPSMRGIAEETTRAR